GDGRANCSKCGSESGGWRTAVVGSFPANAFGLRDMHGNVWEWVEDGWHANYNGAPGDGSAWLIGADNSRHVIRGGSWMNPAPFVRAAQRHWQLLGSRADDVGFRIARTLSP